MTQSRLFLLGGMMVLNGVLLQAMDMSQQPTLEGEKLYQEFLHTFMQKGEGCAAFKSIQTNLDLSLEKVYWSLRCISQKSSNSFDAALHNLQALSQHLQPSPKQQGEAVEQTDSRWLFTALHSYVKKFQSKLEQQQKCLEEK